MTETSIRFKVETRDANKEVAKLERQVRKLEKAVVKAGGTTRTAETGFKAFGKGAQVAGASAKSLGVAVKGILGPLSLVAGAVAALVGGFKGFVEADKARAAVKTLGVDAQTLESQLVGVVARTKGLASTNQLLAASYDVASAGFDKAADITKILEASVLGAVGGMTDIATVSDAATSVMNAYGLSTDKVSKIVDGFIQTQNDGKIVVGQYASQIGRVAPIAAAAGVGLDELNAAISTITAQGVPVESTFAGIGQVIASVLKPTSEAATRAKELGLEFNTAAIKSKGFAGFLQDVIEKTGGSEVEITKLFGSVDALKALMPLISGDLETFNQNLLNQKNATGAAGQAADIMGETVSSQISRIVNSITTLVRGLDQVLGPAIKGVLDLINNVITAAVTATAKLSEFFQRSRAQRQAMEEAGARIGRGTFKGDPKAIAARAEEIFQQSQTSSQPQTTQPPSVNTELQKLLEQLENQPKSQASKISGKSDAEREAEKEIERLERIAKLSAERVRSLEEQTRLAAAITDEERIQIERQINLENIQENRKGLTDDQLKAELQATHALYEQQDATKTLTEENKKQADAKAKAQAEEKKRADELKNIYQGIGDTIADGVVNALKGAVDGTTSLAQAATSLLDNLASQILQVARNMLFFGNLTGNLTAGSGILGSLFGGARANGGSVTGGSSYLVGEKGPELFTPGRSGSIAPSGSFGGTNVTVNVDASGSNVQGDQPSAKALGSAIGAAVQSELIKQKRPGGLLAS